MAFKKKSFSKDCVSSMWRKGYKDLNKKTGFRDFPSGAVVKNLPANAGDMGSSPGPGSGKTHIAQSN